MNRRHAIALAAVLLPSAFWLWTQRSGILVVVRNEEPHVVRGLEVSTTAGVYVLGDLAPGASASTLIGSRGESTVRVAWSDAGGVRALTDVGPYFEGGPDGTTAYGGEVHVKLVDGRAASEHDVSITLSPFSRGAAPAPDRTGPERYPR